MANRTDGRAARGGRAWHYSGDEATRTIVARIILSHPTLFHKRYVSSLSLALLFHPTWTSRRTSWRRKRDRHLVTLLQHDFGYAHASQPRWVPPQILRTRIP